MRLESLEQRRLLSVGGVGDQEAALSFSAADLNLQVITVDPPSQSVAPGDPVSFAVDYHTDPPDPTLMGLALRMHFNSSVLTLDGLGDVFANNWFQQQQQDDTLDFDGDPGTDRYVLVAWQDFAGGAWPGQIPVTLFTASFTSSQSNVDPTSVNFTSSSTAAGWALEPTSAIINFTTNNLPTANDDTVTANEDDSLEIPASDLLANDSDPDTTDTLTVTEVDGTGTTGLVSLVGTTLSYDPNGQFESLSAGETASDTFSYTIDDGNGGTDTASVTVAINGANNLPVADDDSVATTEDTAVDLSAAELLGNDFDPDTADTLTVTEVDAADDGVLVNDVDAEGDPLTATLLSNVSHGTLSFNADGTVTYEHDGSETTSDGFTYQVNDGTADGNVAAVSITIVLDNEAPVAVDDSYTVAEGGTLAADDVDGTFTYEHDGSETTFDSFIYLANDGQADSQEVTVSITIEAVNEVPSAADDGFRVDTGEMLTADAPGILANDVDGDGDPLVAMLVDGPSHGTLALEIDGSFTYTPDADFSGVDGFTYRANDGQADSNQATVTITVDQSLGTIDFVRRSDLLPLTGDKWFRFSASRDGILTAELTAEEFVPDAEITLYADGGGDLQELASGPTRIDYDQAVGGQQYALRVADVQSGVDLVLANLLQISPDGSQVTVYGTEGDDTFEALAGVPRVMIVNGVRYESDVAAGLQIIGGDGSDVAELHGSDGDDVFYADPSQGALFRPDVYYNRAKFFEEVYADAHEGDRDEAFLYDSPSVDLLEADGNWVRLSNRALDFLFEAQAFDYAKPTAGQLGSNNQNVPSDLSILDFDLDLTDW